MLEMDLVGAFREHASSDVIRRSRQIGSSQRCISSLDYGTSCGHYICGR